MTTLTVAFDVDGCLRSRADGDPVACEKVRTLLVLLAQFGNVDIRVWSGSGELYARQVAREIGIAPYVDAYSAKSGATMPDIAVDDEDVNLGRVNLKVSDEP
jgi:hypothetical protein